MWLPWCGLLYQPIPAIPWKNTIKLAFWANIACLLVGCQDSFSQKPTENNIFGKDFSVIDLTKKAGYQGSWKNSLKKWHFFKKKSNVYYESGCYYRPQLLINKSTFLSFRALSKFCGFESLSCYFWVDINYDSDFSTAGFTGTRGFRLFRWQALELTVFVSCLWKIPWREWSLAVYADDAPRSCRNGWWPRKNGDL